MNIKSLITILLITNTITFITFGIDKYKAIKGQWRISERALLTMCVCFGSVGGLLGMKFFHHKTKKWYFYVVASLSFIAQSYFLYIMYA